MDGTFFSDFVTQTSIASSVDIPSPPLVQLLNLSEQPTGVSGNVNINTPILRVSDQAQIAVENKGLGNGGTLNLTVGSLKLNNLAQISAATQAGDGGNISVTASESITLKNGGQISATAGGTGSGGNISIDTNFLILFDNSSITANAFEGNGGNINIKAQGLFVSPNTRITASSQFGIDGTVTLETVETLDKIAIQTVDRFEQIDQNLLKSCFNDRSTTLTYTGASGLPLNPSSGVDNSMTIIKIPQPSENFNPPAPQPQKLSHLSSSEWKLGDPIVEATARIRTEDGRILLVSEPTEEPYEILEVLCNIKDLSAS